MSPSVGFCAVFREFQADSDCVSCIGVIRHNGFLLKLNFMFLVRALEERLQEKQLSSPGLELEHVLLQLDVAQKKEQHLQSEVTHLENR